MHDEIELLVLTTPDGLIFCGHRDAMLALAAALPRAYLRPVRP